MKSIWVTIQPTLHVSGIQCSQSQLQLFPFESNAFTKNRKNSCFFCIRVFYKSYALIIVLWLQSIWDISFLNNQSDKKKRTIIQQLLSFVRCNVEFHLYLVFISATTYCLLMSISHTIQYHQGTVLSLSFTM